LFEAGGMRPVFNMILEKRVEKTEFISASVVFAGASTYCTRNGARNSKREMN
jgi:hypothetical protein